MSRLADYNFRKTQFNGLETLVYSTASAEAKATTHAASEKPPVSQPVIALLHGFGADFSDLATLAEWIQPSLKTPHTWLFFNAPHTVELGPHMQGRAWFPLRLAELEANGFDFETKQPEGMQKAVDRVLQALKDAAQKLNFQLSDLVLGGFSQGAMIASHVAAQSPTALKGLTLFSAALVDRSKLESSRQLRKLSYFQSHGTQDPLLELNGAEKLERILIEQGARGMLLTFRGGHEIPQHVLRDWTSWLNGI